MSHLNTRFTWGFYFFLVRLALHTSSNAPLHEGYIFKKNISWKIRKKAKSRIYTLPQNIKICRKIKFTLLAKINVRKILLGFYLGYLIDTGIFLDNARAIQVHFLYSYGPIDFRRTVAYCSLVHSLTHCIWSASGGGTSIVTEPHCI